MSAGIRSPMRSRSTVGELQQPAGVDVVVHPPHPHALARVAAQRPDPLAHAGHAVGRGVAERRLAVLDVVVERPLDEGDVAERERHQPEPVVVEVGELGRREGQGVLEQVAAGNSDAAPVTVLATSSESRLVWLLSRRLQ